VPGRISGFSLAYTATGAVVLWSGIKGTSISDTFRSLLGGKLPAAGTQPITSSASASTASASSAGSAAAAALGFTGASTATAAANQAIARLLTAPYGWSAGQEWDDLVSLWNRESGWNQYAQNPTSGAYGIPQALPPSKLPAAGQASGGSSPAAQISWGLQYIQQTYGSPSGAWAHEESAGWY